MYKIKKLAIVTLAVLILAVIPVRAFAAESQETEPSKHVHNYVFRNNYYGYTSNGDVTHMVITYPNYRCSGCGNTKVLGQQFESQEHYMGAYYYTGENYHSGSLHYAKYTSSCIQCRHVKYKWEPYQCPGNGNCILPQSVTPVPAEK